MNVVKIILLCTCIFVALTNALACYRVLVSDSFEPLQKVIQCVLIWLLPILGAGLAYALTREPKMTMRGYQKDNSASDMSDVFVGNGSGDYLGSEHHID